MANDLITTRPVSLLGPLDAHVPTIVAAEGDHAARRFLEFFAATIRNANTREAYLRAVVRFFAWAQARGVQRLDQIEPLIVAAYVEALQADLSAPSVKQHLAAVRMLFDWMVTGGVLRTNPCASVRGPKHVVKVGKTPVLGRDEARHLLDSIDVSHVVGLRDRALIALMIYSFARVSAALAMNVEDYFPQGKRWWVRLHEKGGKHHVMPAHHSLEEYLDAYITAAGITDEKKGPLFRTAAGRARRLTLNRLQRREALAMIGRRAGDADILTRIGNHSFRATGITAYLESGGALELAQQMAAHESPRTTKLYDRTAEQISLDEIERIVI